MSLLNGIKNRKQTKNIITCDIQKNAIEFVTRLLNTFHFITRGNRSNRIQT